MMDNLERMKELAAVLKEASRLYYQESSEMMSNLEYDRLYDELLSLEKETGVVLSGSPTQSVGYEVLSELPKKAHPSPMLSLNKTKSAEELAAFLGTQPGLLSWKMDGLTIVLTYDRGSLQEALTRGNGEIGEIITPNARRFVNVPLTLPFKGRLVLRGEAVITYPDFAAINAAIPEGEEKYKNPRNLCSGSVRQLDSAVTAARKVRFEAFSLVEAEGKEFTWHHEEFEWLKSLGFDVVFYREVTAESIPQAVAAFSEEVAGNPIPSDGLVLLMDDIAYGASLGRTAKFPRNGIAFKWADEQQTTRLKEVEWSASRTGLINPVAIFEPVELEGTVVSRASVHNVSILEQLALGFDDEISVYKANMIIPQIAENLTRSGTVKPPKYCPVCGKETVIREENGVKTLHCPNAACPAKQIKAFDLFVSRDAINIEGLSESTLEKLVDLGIVRKFRDLFYLQDHRNAIMSMEGFGAKSFRNLQEAAEKARHTTPVRFLTALGIEGIGPATAKLICRHFGNDIAAIRSASAEDFTEINMIGDVMADSLVRYFRDPENAAMLDDLVSVLDIRAEEGVRVPQTLEGMNVVITGGLLHFANREALQAEIEARGGKAAGSVSAKTFCLVNNDPLSSSTKNKTAQKLGVPILTEDEFIEKYMPEVLA